MSSRSADADSFLYRLLEKIWENKVPIFIAGALTFALFKMFSRPKGGSDASSTKSNPSKALHPDKAKVLKKGV